MDLRGSQRGFPHVVWTIAARLSVVLLATSLVCGQGTAPAPAPPAPSADDGHGTPTAAPTIPLPSGKASVSTLGAGVAEATFDNVARPVLESYADELKSPQQLKSISNRFRVMIDEVRLDIAARLKERVAERAAVFQQVVSRLIEEVQRGASTDAGRTALLTFVNEAVNESQQLDRRELERQLICWCPKEGWTKTLAGCPDGCATEQKTMVAQGIAAGMTNQEIIEEMVAHPKGGEQVRASPKNTGINVLSRWLPVVFLIFGLAIVLAVLQTRSRGSSSAGDTSTADPPDDEARWDALIEQELKEMDN